MPFSARIFRMIESELSGKLCFPFTIRDNLTRPGSKTIRPRETFTFTVWVRNDSGIAMKNLRGAIHPARLVRFQVQPFSIDKLATTEQIELATLQAHIVEAPQTGNIFNQLATVNVVGQADLSSFRFQETDRELVYARPAIGDLRLA